MAKNPLDLPASTLNRIPLPSRYAKLPNAHQVYAAICYTLSERRDQVDWGSFTPRHWKLLERMAQNEGVAPLMYWNFKDSALPVPEQTFKYLQGEYYKTYARNTLLYQELGRILQALDEAGIPVIVLKGAALAVTVYEDIGLRPMTDLDLLVLPSDLEQAIIKIKQSGFELEKASYHIVFSDGSSDINVELHWHLASMVDDGYQGDEHFYRYENSSLAEPMYLLRPAADLLYLAAHLSIQHNQDPFRLLWLNDFYQLLVQNEHVLDWDWLDERLENQDLRVYMQEVIQAIIPRWGFNCAEVILILEGMCKKTEGVEIRNPDPTEDIRKFLLSKSWGYLNWSMRLRIIGWLLFPSSAYLRWRYGIRNAWQTIFYYPYRWVDIYLESD